MLRWIILKVCHTAFSRVLARIGAILKVSRHNISSISVVIIKENRFYLLHQDSRMVEFSYFHLPILIIFAVNAILFTLTSTNIRRVQQNMVRWNCNELNRQCKNKFTKNRAQFGPFVRLFIVMGVTWVMEPLSWFFDHNNDQYFYFFLLTDLLNCCQGILIFVLFVMKPKIKKMLLER